MAAGDPPISDESHHTHWFGKTSTFTMY